MKLAQICTFRVGPNLFGLEVELVHEVIRHRRLTPVPLAASEVEGLMNLRGQIVTVIDLHRRLGLPEGDRIEATDAPDDAHGSDESRTEDGPDVTNRVNLILYREGNPVSLLVDEVEDVLLLDMDDFDLPPATLTGIGRDLITKAYMMPGRLLLLLDVERVVAVGETAGETR